MNEATNIGNQAVNTVNQVVNTVNDAVADAEAVQQAVNTLGDVGQGLANAAQGGLVSTSGPSGSFPTSQSAQPLDPTNRDQA